ncbi:MAG: hypothetical protein PHU21_05285, partial [Elusimicrobia bacterium]|nr:hypothetical protein [Elusimicrobiota bacterium]
TAPVRLPPRLGAGVRTAGVIQGRMKLARLMELSEADLEGLARELEGQPLFQRLAAARVVVPAEFLAARLVARNFAGYGLRLSGGGLPELCDGGCDLVRLIRGMGQERFMEWFLGEKAVSDEERARACGVTPDEARRLREFADRAFIQGEFETAVPVPAKVFSAVAGFSVEGGRPALAFFHREVWKKRFKVDRERLRLYLEGLPEGEAGKVRRLLQSLEFVEQRKTTLYALLERVLETQAEYLVSGEPGRRRPLTQRSAAEGLGVHPSVLCRLVSNKCVQMPWGLEAPLAVFFPSAKDVNKEKVCALAEAHSDWKDEELAAELARLHGVRLSRRSIAQYRKDLALGGRGRRG